MVQYKKLLSDAVKAIVDNPDEVTVVESISENGDINLVLSIAPSDMGKVIGKHGRIAKALRTVMKAAATPQNKRVNVEIR